MGKDLAEKYPDRPQTFEEADDALGYKLSQLCFEGPEDQLRLTEITQPAILTVPIAALRVLESRMPKPSFVCGHSLGEYSAHVAAGTFSFADAVRTVRNRGKYMQEAVPVGVRSDGRHSRHGRSRKSPLFARTPRKAKFVIPPTSTRPNRS